MTHLRNFLLLTLSSCLFACDTANVDHTNAETTPTIKTATSSTEKVKVKPLQNESQKSSDANNKNAKNTLWKIKGKHGNTVYLVGSVHLMRPDAYPLHQAYETAYQDSEKLVFEIDEEIQDQFAAQMAVQNYAGIEGGGLLKDKISAGDYAEIKALAKKNKVPMLTIDPFDPWFSSMQLAVMQYMNAGFSPEYGIDHYFMSKAQEDDKPILGLETMDEQFQIFDSMSYPVQVEMLKETLQESEDIDAMIDAIDENWREGDMEELEELLMEEFADEPEFYDKLLKQRNENWIPQLLPMLEDMNDDYMVVVGAAHMLGDDGVLTLLEQEGYSAEQL